MSFSLLVFFRPITSSLYLLLFLALWLIGWFMAFIALVVQPITFAHSWCLMVWTLVFTLSFTFSLVLPSFPTYCSFYAHVLTITLLVTTFEIYLSLIRNVKGSNVEAAGLIFMSFCYIAFLFYTSAYDSPIVQLLKGYHPSSSWNGDNHAVKKKGSPPQLPQSNVSMSPFIVPMPLASASGPSGPSAPRMATTTTASTLPRESAWKKFSGFFKANNDDVEPDVPPLNSTPSKTTYPLKQQQQPIQPVKVSGTPLRPLTPSFMQQTKNANAPSSVPPSSSSSSSSSNSNMDKVRRPSSTVRPAPVVGPPATYTHKAKALFTYTGNPSDPEELSFEKDEILDIASPQGNRWWQAKKKNGKTGIVPSNYLQLL